MCHVSYQYCCTENLCETKLTLVVIFFFIYKKKTRSFCIHTKQMDTFVRDSSLHTALQYSGRPYSAYHRVISPRQSIITLLVGERGSTKGQQNDTVKHVCRLWNTTATRRIYIPGTNQFYLLRFFYPINVLAFAQCFLQLRTFSEQVIGIKAAVSPI